MKTKSPKNALIRILLIHGVIINLLLFPLIFCFSIYVHTAYLSLSEWVKSICINLFAWQIIEYLNKNSLSSTIQVNIQSELEKYTTLNWLNRKLKIVFASQFLRKVILNILVWTIIVFNLLFPIIAVVFFDFEIDFTFCCIWFVLFQFVYFIFYYFNGKHFNSTIEPNQEGESPWFLDSVFINLIGK